MTLTELQARREQLLAIRYSPVRKVVVSPGVEITYNSPEEVAAAIAAIDAEIAEASGTTAPRHLRIGMRNYGC